MPLDVQVDGIQGSLRSSGRQHLRTVLGTQVGLLAMSAAFLLPSLTVSDSPWAWVAPAIIVFVVVVCGGLLLMWRMARPLHVRLTASQLTFDGKRYALQDVRGVRDSEARLLVQLQGRTARSRAVDPEEMPALATLADAIQQALPSVRQAKLEAVESERILGEAERLRQRQLDAT